MGRSAARRGGQHGQRRESETQRRRGNTCWSAEETIVEVPRRSELMLGQENGYGGHFS